MPTTFGVKVEGLKSLQAKMAATPKLQKKYTKKAINAVAIQMSREWKKQLRGPSSRTRLGVRSGNLRQSINTRKVRAHTTYAVDVGTGLPYAKVHEFGFNGTVRVRAHDREGHTVRAHSRRMRMPKRPHMRPAIKATRKKMPGILRAQYKAFLRERKRITRPD